MDNQHLVMILHIPTDVGPLRRYLQFHPDHQLLNGLEIIRLGEKRNKEYGERKITDVYIYILDEEEDYEQCVCAVRVNSQENLLVFGER
jgi:hypothetical protein